MFWSRKKIRVRIAPSPTGLFHVGTARTALLNWLYARGEGGVFVVRIEDTDKARSDKKYERDILEGLKWLGLDWDEGPDPADDFAGYKGKYGPYRQSERGKVYSGYAEKLLRSGKAYYCFCSEDELERERGIAEAAKQSYRYSGRCRNILLSEAEERLRRGESAVIRAKIPEEKITWMDAVRGEVVFDSSLFGDIVIAKSKAEPLYNFSVVIDDFEMKISDVIRGEDHIANTPKQIALQKIMGLPTPRYAHLPLILNSDRSKMSKRLNATSVTEYRNKGYLPEAMVNFLVLLGWHPEDDREIFTVNELTKEFALARVQKSGAVWDQQKLDWLNAEYLKKLSDKEIVLRLGLEPNEKNLKVVELVKERLKRLSDFPALTEFIGKLPEYEAVLLRWKESPVDEVADNLRAAKAILTGLPESEFASEGLTRALHELAERRGRGNVLWPLRVALSGQKASPGPYEIMAVLGKNETLTRIENALRKLEKI